ncbi:MAG: nucleoside hydrolase [Pseudomonadota bacterium]|nr:nucleoside hydrolase [Pseudomonadota bacterium]
MTKKIIIDTDPAMGTKGGDPEDCFAIMLALNSPELHIEGITTVQGNVPVERGFSNVTYLLNELGKDIPIHSGTTGTYDPNRNKERLWLGKRDNMEQIAPLLPIEDSRIEASSFISTQCSNNPKEIELVTIGPLTNIARALDLNPNLNKEIKKITMMAGAAKVPGNITPAAEFNVWADPEAASKVFESGIDITMVPLDVCHKTRLSKEQLVSIGDHEHPFCKFVLESVKPWINIRSELVSDEGLHLYDSLAMAICFMPELVECQSAYVGVETAGNYSTGETVCEFNESIMGKLKKQEPNAQVALNLDVKVFNKIFYERVISFLKTL